MFIYIKAPLAHRVTTTECLTKKKPQKNKKTKKKTQGPKADVNEMATTTGSSETPACMSRGCVGVRAVRIHLRQSVTTLFFYNIIYHRYL